jgi:hypothetical protein
LDYSRQLFWGFCSEVGGAEALYSIHRYTITPGSVSVNQSTKFARGIPIRNSAPAVGKQGTVRVVGSEEPFSLLPWLTSCLKKERRGGEERERNIGKEMVRNWCEARGG